MFKKGFSFLNKRANNSLELAELLNEVLIPPYFKLFLNQFEIELDYIAENIVYFNEEKYYFSKLEMFNNEIVDGEEYYSIIDYIFSYHRLLEEVEKYKKKEENWNKLGLMQIGLMHSSDVLLIGVEKENQDQIWRYGQGMGIVTCKLNDNIFDFFSRLKLVIDEEALNEIGVNNAEKFYRNWGEDFWRVREDEA